MTKIKLKFKSVLFYAARVFSVALSSIIIWFLISFINSGVSADYFILLLIFALLFIVPGIAIFIKKKVAIWIYSICLVLLVASAIFNYTNWTLSILPIWIAIIIAILIYEIRNDDNN